MTDFLTRLAERSLGLTPQVRPRLGSRYAPGPEMPPSTGTWAEEHALPSEPSAELTQSPTPCPHQGPLSPSKPVLPAAMPDPVQEPLRRAEFIPPERMEQPRRAEFIPPDRMEQPRRTEFLPPERTHVHATMHRGVVPGRAPEMQPAFQTPQTAGASPVPAGTAGRATPSAAVGGEASTEPLRGPSEPVRVQAPAGPDRRGTPAAEAVPVSLTTSRLPPAERLIPEAPAAPLPRAQVPHERRDVLKNGGGDAVRPVVEHAARGAAAGLPPPAARTHHGETFPPAAEPEPPAIRVTIGRIEVRAVFPPAPAVEHPAPARASPVLSLEEYLRQHREVQR